MALDKRHTPNDMRAFWMPFTANRQFKSNPRMFVAAEGMHYTTSDGRQVLDGTAGLWCCNAGHARPKIVEAIQRQAAELDYAPAFQMGHPLAFEFDLDGPPTDGTDNQSDESIEYMGETAIAVRSNYDFASEDFRGREELYELTGSSCCPIVTTGNDEILAFALGKDEGDPNPPTETMTL